MYNMYKGINLILYYIIIKIKKTESIFLKRLFYISMGIFTVTKVHYFKIILAISLIEKGYKIVGLCFRRYKLQV